MILYQKQGAQQYYIGWYGACDETGAPDSSNVSTPCQALNLPTSKYADDNTLVEWSNGKGAFREQLVRVAQIQGTGVDYSYYSMENIRDLREFYLSIGMDTASAIAAADQSSANPPNLYVDFDQLICGKAYTIVISPGTGGTNFGDIVSQVEIPEFQYLYVGDADSGLRLTPECCGYSV